VTTFVLIPGAGGDKAYWALLAPELESRGHGAIAVDIPENDPDLGLAGFALMVEDAMSGVTDAVLVAQSLGGFTAPMVHKPVRMVVLLNAMVPTPGESPDEWWSNTNAGDARSAADMAAGRDPEFDLERHFFHDLPASAKAMLLAGEHRAPSPQATREPCEFTTWPDVAIKVLVGRDDRFFPASFQQRVARERLGIEADQIAGGHLLALSNPQELADRLVSYLAEIS
jgi:pimeloyl-ACP methyl ester carboxylesterase